MDKKMNEIVERIATLLPDGYSVEAVVQTKNNGVKVPGVTIRKDKNIAPIFYVNPNDVIGSVGKVFKELEAHEKSITFDIPELTKDYILRNTFPMLVNYERNLDKVEKCPNIRRFDLVVLFKVKIKTNTLELASVLLTYELTDYFDISIQELDKACVDYAMTAYQSMRMVDILRMVCCDISELDLAGTPPMWVITTTGNRIYGASALVYGLDVFRHFYVSLYIFPSSVHELVVVAAYGNDISVNEMRAMVAEINASAVEAEEYLSDSVYYYDCTEYTITEVK